MGRPITDEEWRTFKQLHLTDAAAESSGPTTVRGWQWTRRDMALCLLGAVSIAVGVGLILDADVVYSPVIRIALGIYVWVIALIAIRLWLEGFVSPPHDFWTQLWWLWWGLFFGVIFWIPLVLAAGAMVFEDRDFLNESWRWLDNDAGSRDELVGLGLILVGAVEAVFGRPTRQE